MSKAALLEEKQVLRAWHEAERKVYFSIVDFIALLAESIDNERL